MAAGPSWALWGMRSQENSTAPPDLCCLGPPTTPGLEHKLRKLGRVKTSLIEETGDGLRELVREESAGSLPLFPSSRSALSSAIEH